MAFLCPGTIKIVHPVHLHGHHFHVLKIAYPPFDPETGNSTAFNPDIRCLNEQCTRATWADPSWINGDIPGLNLINPPLKDTINVPANGYVIIRFIADNPGILYSNLYIILNLTINTVFWNISIRLLLHDWIRRQHNYTCLLMKSKPYWNLIESDPVCRLFQICFLLWRNKISLYRKYYYIITFTVICNYDKIYKGKT